MKPEKYEALFNRLFEDLCKKSTDVNDAYNWLNDVGFTVKAGPDRKLAILKAEGFLKEKLKEVPGVSAREAGELAKFATTFCYKDNLEGHGQINWTAGLH